jgi:hypothetical protein
MQSALAFLTLKLFFEFGREIYKVKQFAVLDPKTLIADQNILNNSHNWQQICK